MPASYSDILLGKLSLQYQIITAMQLHECLNALEAGQRAGVVQTLTQVLVKRGYLTRAAQRDLDVAVSQAERGRRAKLIVQLLLKHGRPGEGVLRAYYESLKSQGFPLDLAQALEQYQQISRDERAGLESAIERAIPALVQREAEELAQTVEAMRQAGAPGGAVVPPPLSAGGAVTAYRATGMRQAYSPDGSAQALYGPGAGSGPIPAQAVAAAAAYMRATGMRAAYVPGPDGVPVAVAVPATPGMSAPSPVPGAGPAPAPGAIDPNVAPTLSGAQIAAAQGAGNNAPLAPPAAGGALPSPAEVARQTGIRQAYNPDQSGGIPVPQPPPPPQAVPPPPVRATGMRAAYVMGPDGTPVAVAVPAAPMPGQWPGMPAMPGMPMGVPGMPMPGMPMPGMPGMPGMPVPALMPGYPGMPQAYGMTGQRQAYGNLLQDLPQFQVAAPPVFQPPAGLPQGAPPGGPGPGAIPPQFGRTMERQAADMKVLPAWAKTGVRKIDPDAMKIPAREEPKGQGKQDKLAEPQGPVPGYEMQEKIGKGRIGVVYRALEKESGRIVALKVMYPIFLKNAALVERFKREASIASKLDHPNIRRVYSGGEAGGHLFIAMEMVEGETLQEKIEKSTVLAEPDCLRWIAQIARAMDHYSRAGLIHRDVKPEHVLVAKDNRALLCELGMSKKHYEEYAQTVQGTSFGSPYYVSPEQGMGVDELDIRSDIYSLGVTLFHCLTGRVPFLGGNAGVIISKHATEAIPDTRKLNPKITKGTGALIERMMAKKRDDRHKDPKELLAEIAWLRSESGIAATPIVPLDPPSADDKAVAEAQAPKRKTGFFGRMLRAVGLAK